VFCIHEAFSTSRQFTEIFEFGYEYAGSVDTNPVKAKEYLKDLGAPLVIIKRNVPDVVESLCKLFGEVNRKEISLTMESMSKVLKEAELYADLIVDFEDLDERLEEIWDMCIPTKKMCRVKKIGFEHLVINTKMPKSHTFKKFIKEAH